MPFDGAHKRQGNDPKKPDANGWDSGSDDDEPDDGWDSDPDEHPTKPDHPKAAPDHRRPRKPRKKNTRLRDWLLARLDAEHQDIIEEFLEVDENVIRTGGLHHIPMEEMMTPYPISRVIAVRTYQILRFMGMLDIHRPMSTITFMDLMAGTGVDGFAMKEIYGRQVNLIVCDVDPVRAQFMKLLYIEHNANPGGECKGESSQEHAIKSVQVEARDAEKITIPNIDVLYLDPVWPTHKFLPYTINATELSQFIDQRLDDVPTLRMVIIKVSSDWIYGPLKDHLMQLCGKKQLCLEEFFPAGGKKKGDTHNGQILDRAMALQTTSTHWLRPGLKSLPGNKPPDWNYQWNTTFTYTDDVPGGMEAYCGKMRIIYITRDRQADKLLVHGARAPTSVEDPILWNLGGLHAPKTIPAAAAASASDLPAGFTTLDVSCFM